MVSPSHADLSWSEEVPYLCNCGLSFRVKRIRWVDVEAQRELRDTIIKEGPIRGTCPRCGQEARGRGPWLEILKTKKKAVLVLAASQRAELVDQLKAHLDRVGAQEGSYEAWMLRPDWRFERPRALRSDAVPGVEQSAVPSMVGGDDLAPMSPKSTGSDAFVCDLKRDGSSVVVDIALGEAERRLWGQAALRVRPILLTLGKGYPLLGVRVVGSYLGQTSVVDAVGDPAVRATVDIFRALGREFRLHLRVRDSEQPSAAGISREVSARGLERNALLCLDSAGEILADLKSQPPSKQGRYVHAHSELEEMNRSARLQGAKTSLAAGAYQHLVMPDETLRALEELDAASQRENLRRLLQVDGLAVGEFEEIRKRVLCASLEQGLCAPPRFWKRVIDLGLATDFTGYAQQLAENRQRIESSGADDLSAERASAARNDILELCRRKRVALPHVLEAYLRGGGDSGSGGVGAASGSGMSGVGPVDGDFERASAVDMSTAAAIPMELCPVPAEIRGEAEGPETLPATDPAHHLEPLHLQEEPVSPGDGARKASPAAVSLLRPHVAGGLLSGQSGQGALSAAEPEDAEVELDLSDQLESSDLADVQEISELDMQPFADEAPVAPPIVVPPAVEPDVEESHPDLSDFVELQDDAETGPEGQPEDGDAGEKPAPSAWDPTFRSLDPLSQSAALRQATVEFSPLQPGESGEFDGEAPLAEELLKRFQNAQDEGQKRVLLAGALRLFDEADAASLPNVIGVLVQGGVTVVPSLLQKLDAPKMERRRAAAVALGCIGGSMSVSPLVEGVFRESSAAWEDMARAASRGGKQVVEILQKHYAGSSQLLEAEGRLRGQRLLAEVLAGEAAQGGKSGARDAVRELAEEAKSPLGELAAEALQQESQIRATRKALLECARRGEGDLRGDFASRAYGVLHRLSVDLAPVLSS